MVEFWIQAWCLLIWYWDPYADVEITPGGPWVPKPYVLGLGEPYYLHISTHSLVVCQPLQYARPPILSHIVTNYDIFVTETQPACI